MARHRHKNRRRLVKKQKRKQKRQAIAKFTAEKKERELEISKQSADWLCNQLRIAEEERLKLQEEEGERQCAYHIWLEREAVAQRDFQELQEKRNKAREDETRRKEDQELCDQRAAAELAKNRELEVSNATFALFEMHISQVAFGTSRLSTGGIIEVSGTQWHNPYAPCSVPHNDYGSVRLPCTVFKRTGTCKFEAKCVRFHEQPSTSRTLLFSNMFRYFAWDKAYRNEVDPLEFDENDEYSAFLEFYEDVLPEFEQSGRVVQFKVCKNATRHLRGSVYVQYARVSEAVAAHSRFAFRWYDGRLLLPEYVEIDSWREAICGLFYRNRCMKGRRCHFLHPFLNPHGRFNDADRDLTMKYEGNRSDARSGDAADKRHRKHKLDHDDALESTNTTKHKHKKQKRKHHSSSAKKEESRSSCKRYNLENSSC